jgi:hypothetical protein
MLRSTRRISQSSGKMAATVNNPSGGKAAFLEIYFNAYLKLQKVSGYFGYTRSAFIDCNDRLFSGQLLNSGFCCSMIFK